MNDKARKQDQRPRPEKKGKGTDASATCEGELPQVETLPPGDESDRAGEPMFPVVGVGASAGGLEAIETLLRHLPSDLGVAVVFVQHLSPVHESSLVDILPRSTKMPVQEAGDGMALQPNHVYVIPPNRDLAVMRGVLQLMARPQPTARHMPIDYFFRSLAEDQQGRAIGVVLSGTGSDGSLGLKAIKAEGGITLAQDEESARYSGMPHAAAATGLVDFVLPPEGIASELVRIVRHRHLHPPVDRKKEPAAFGAPEAMQKIFFLLRQSTGVDFSQYKQSTVERRIARRMIVHRLNSPVEYLKYLQKTPGETLALFDDMLISVTGFFREPETLDSLHDKVFPRILADRAPEAPIRVWVPGCATGEEAYSIAILLLEYLGQRSQQAPIQIFGTDISEASIARARAGYYAANIAGDVSEPRLRQFFVRAGDGYQISKNVRDLCIFARQNVVKDPPFSNLDLVSCRNLLIYLGPTLQRRLIPTFHYALRPTGYLLLGRSETVGPFAELFSLVDREKKIPIYAKKMTATRLPPDLARPEPDTFVERPKPPALSDDRITGAVLTLVDVTDTRRAGEWTRQAKVLAEGIVATVRQPLLVLDERLTVVMANRAFYRAFSVAASETEGRLVYELGKRQWDHPDLRRLLEEIIPRDTQFEGFQMVHDFPRVGRKRVQLDARRLHQEGDGAALILLGFSEIAEA